MPKAGGGSCLAGKPLTQLGVVLDENFDGDLALERGIPGEVQGPHAAVTDLADDLITPECGGNTAHFGTVANCTMALGPPWRSNVTKTTPSTPRRHRGFSLAWEEGWREELPCRKHL